MALTHDEFCDSFIDVEEREDLFAYRVKGRVIWDYLRYPYFYHLLRQALRTDEIGFSARRGVGRLLSHLRGVPRYLRSGGSPRRADSCDILVVNYERKQAHRGKLINLTLYPIVMATHDRHRVVVLDPSLYSDPLEAHYPCEVRYSRPLMYRARLRSRFIRYSSSERHVFAEISRAFAKRFGDVPDIDYMVRRYVSYQLALRREYRHLFAELQPKVVVHADSGDAKGWIEAAHDMGVAVVDFQHSLIGKNNILYRYPSSAHRYELRTLSDYILTFGEFWHGAFDLATKLVAVGFPYLEAGVHEARAASVERRSEIVVISSMHSGKKLEQITLKLAELLPDHRIVYKLRPEEYARWREAYSPELSARPNIRVVSDDRVPLYEIFARAGHQIGINSTALIEGLAFDLQTFIVKDGWYAEMNALIDAGIVALVEDAEEIAEKVRQRTPGSPRGTRQLLFKEGSVENVQRFFAEVVSLH